MSGEFRLAIRLANAEMQTPTNVAEALVKLASTIETTNRSQGSIMDVNGGTVGSWGAEWPEPEANS
jgi:hypothetical protein